VRNATETRLGAERLTVDAVRSLGGTEKRMTSVTRRMALKTVALATTSLAMPFVCEVHAAGHLSRGFSDRRVPGADHTTIKPR